MTSLRKLTCKPLLLCALAVAVGAAVLLAVWPTEPTYQGKPLSFWLDKFPETIVNKGPGSSIQTSKATEEIIYDLQTQSIEQTFSPNEGPAARSAINAIGADCFPSLLRRLQTKDTALSRAREKLSTFGVRLGFCKRAWALDAQCKRGQAVTALIQLGKPGIPVLPAVVALATDPDPGVRASALEVLRRLSPGDYAQFKGEQDTAKTGPR